MAKMERVKDTQKRTKLTKKEQLYFDIIKSGNVLFLKGAPGTAKSAITSTIARIKGYQHVALHLAQSDNVDLGQYPVPKEVDGITVIDYAVPGWAMKANSEPTIIHFEELNRCRQDIQDAALQLLNEREIGTNFKFNDNVLMVSSGNLGEKDGTEVKELDNAMNNRLAHRTHTLTLKEWIKGYAKENVSEIIVSFLEAHPEYYLKTPKTDEPRYPTPRSWTNLDKFIRANVKDGDTTNLHAVEKQLMRCGADFIGATVTKFVRYINDMKDLNFNDILDRWEAIKSEKMNRIKVSEILQQARKYEVDKMTDKQVDNIIEWSEKIIDTNNEDQFVSYALHVLGGIGIGAGKKFENKPKSIRLARWYKKHLNLMKLAEDNAVDTTTKK